MQHHSIIGQAADRPEGIHKVTGTARYAGDYAAPELVYGYVVNSTITKGKIVRIDDTAAMALPGVIRVFSHSNRPAVSSYHMMYSDMDAPPGRVFMPLHDERIHYNGQPIALVVAESFELARYGASLLEISYQSEEFATSLEANLNNQKKPRLGLSTPLKPPPPKPVGDIDKGLSTAAFRSSGAFLHGTEHHNPLELFSTTTIYEGEGRLTIYDKTQGTINSQLYVADVFGLKYKNVRVLAPYVGGAFGSALRPQHQLFMSVMAALALKRPVRVTLDRTQMFSFGHRPPTWQYTDFGSDANGRITSLGHKAVGETSRFEDYTEMVVPWSHMLYPAGNTRLEYRLVPLDVYTPLDMRAPGGSTGLHAIEITVDDLAHQAGIDPVEMRLRNYSLTDNSSNKPYTTKELRACLQQGAERFGWEKRTPAPRSMQQGTKLIGMGMAAGIWEAMQLPASVEASIDMTGKLRVTSAVTDIGTGTLVVMSQIAAQAMGLPLEQVTFDYGDSKLPFAPIQGGSFTVSTVGSAIQATCEALQKKLLKVAANMHNSPFSKATLAEVRFHNGCLEKIADADCRLPLTDIIQANGGKPIRVKKLSLPQALKLKKYARATHSAAFAEVEIDEALGTIRVTRALTAVAAGTIINPKTARSQILGGMVWGISKALQESTLMDHRYGRYVNQNLAEYHIPVHADMHELDVLFVEEKDTIINQLGVKGIGEIGLVAMVPAIVNAIFHATGKRINHLPIHFDELMA